MPSCKCMRFSKLNTSLSALDGNTVHYPLCRGSPSTCFPSHRPWQRMSVAAASTHHVWSQRCHVEWQRPHVGECTLHHPIYTKLRSRQATRVTSESRLLVLQFVKQKFKIFHSKMYCLSPCYFSHFLLSKIR